MDKRELMQGLCEIGALKFGEFTIKSGKKSPYYVDLRILPSHPRVLRQVGKAMAEMILNNQEKPDVLCGIPAAGLAIANAISFETDIPTFYTKKEPTVYKALATHFRNLLEKGSNDGGYSIQEKLGLEKAIEIIEALSGFKTHGIPRYVDGDFRDGARIGIVDDLITTAESKLETRELILLDAKRRSFNVNLVGVYVLLDREQGGMEALQREGLKLHSLVTIREAAEWLHELGTLSRQMYSTIVEYTTADRETAGLEV
jgi:orotate phosphoribosyltransferase